MVVIKQFTTNQIDSLGHVTGRLLYDATLNLLRFNNTSDYNNILVIKDPNNNLTSINDVYTSGNLGINTSVANKQVEINSSTGDCLRLTYNDNNGGAANYADLTLTSGGNLSISHSGTYTDLNSIVNITDTAESSNTTTGALKIAGGVGIVKKNILVLLHKN